MGELQSFLKNIPSKEHSEMEKDPFLNRFETFLKNEVEPDLGDVTAAFRAKGLPVFIELEEKKKTVSLPTVEKSWIFAHESHKLEDSDVLRLPYISVIAYRKSGEVKVSFVNTGLPGLNTSLDQFDKEGFEKMLTEFLNRSIKTA